MRIANAVRAAIAALILSLGAGLSTASAQVIITNYPGANDGAASTIASITGNFSKAAGFTMPAGSPYSLFSVMLRLRRNDEAATMQLDLFGDVGGNPGGSPLVSFIIPAFGLGVHDVVFTPMSAFELQASTTYWLAGTGASPTADGIQWLASNPGITPTGIATSEGYRFSNTGVYPPGGASGIFNTYQVNGAPATVVPEPATMLLLASGLAGLAAASRRRKRVA